MSRSRQLAAIMFTDIQGYTALMQKNEQQAVRTRDKHRRVFNAATEKYRGRVLQYYGDGTLSVFDSALDAVQCAVEMQLGFQEPPMIPVRIGIHIGDVVFSEEEIFGDSVNIASRIESLAVPGSIFISDKVYDEIRNQPSIHTARLQRFKLKNVDRPVVVYAIANEGLVVPPREDIAGKGVALPDREEPATAATSDLEQAGSLLTTKLFLPTRRPEVVTRDRLLGQLDGGLSGKMTLVSAPAGFGKTTLVSEWARHCGRPVAWLSLDAMDSDPVRLLTYLITALKNVAENLGDRAMSMLQASPPPPVASILTTLLNELSTASEPMLLVLDDYHLIDAPEVDRALAFLIDHLPPSLHLVIATREDPPLPLARLRVRRQLNELRVADLRFTAAETADFLREVMGLSLSAEEVAALEKRTEGWIAGLQMAALSMQGRTDTTGFVRAFTGSHRFILDYLIEEVLFGQSEEVRRFLEETAILEKLSAPLCNTLTGRNDGDQMLQFLERANLFVIPLDDRRQWYRYHHLFADVLRARSTVAPERRRELHRLASEWYEAREAPADAIHHALAAGDTDRAARLIERVWPTMDQAFRLATWMRWVRSLPESILAVRPVLLVGYAWALLNVGEMEAGEAQLRAAERLLASETAAEGELVVEDQEQFRHLPASIATARAYCTQTQGHAADTVRYARRALDLYPAEDHLRRGPAAALLALAHWSNGELEAAYEALAEAMNNFRLAGHLSFAISGTYGLADIRLAQGRLREAERLYERSLQWVADPKEAPVRGTADLYLGLGELCCEQGDLEQARAYLQRSESLGEAAALPNWPYRSAVISAQLKEAEGDLSGAEALLDRAEKLYFRGPVPETRPVAARRVRLWLRQEQLGSAQGWVVKCELPETGPITYLREYEYLTLARVLLAGYRRQEEETTMARLRTLLDRLLAAAKAGARNGSLMEVHILLALLFEARGQLAPALEQLERALRLGEPEGYVRLFTGEGTPIVRLLSEANRRDIHPAYAQRLLAATGHRGSGSSSTEATAPASSTLIEPLSERELEILRLIAQGLSNKAIAERLFLALSTVKGHNQHIFGKLMVRRRTEAVARARELGLI